MRRRSINVWPALADLMTVLAVVGLFTAIEMRRSWVKDRAAIMEDKVKNENMFQAIQRIQDVIDQISQDHTALTFQGDQSLQFGDDLVNFDRNSLEPKWKGDGQMRLRRFCEDVSQKLAGYLELFAVHVEGHTDRTKCPDDPNCNWWFSSNRAATFVAFMKDDDHCPGGSTWDLRPIGLADTKPFSPTQAVPPRPTRRIAVRLVPNYERILGQETTASSHKSLEE